MRYKVTLATLNQLDEIVELVQQRYEPAKDIGKSDLRVWVSWFIQSNLCVVAVESSGGDGEIEMFGQINSLLMGRPISAKADMDSRNDLPYDYNLNGDTFYIDLILADHLTVVPFYRKILEGVLGMTKEYIAFSRDRGKMGTRRYKLEKILRYYEPKTS